MKTLSVITVCYNAEGEIRQTVESVLEQTYVDYEYILVDGKSTDNTVGILESYRKDFERKGIPYRIFSEKDNGIYNAMNNGLQLSDGRWIIYMNAGDTFCDKNVLSQAFDRNLQGIDVLYGDTIYKDGAYYRMQKCRPLEEIVKWMPFCHQSVFVRTDVMMQHSFDERYEIVADYNLFLKLYLEKNTFSYVNIPIAIFESNGISEKKRDQAVEERAIVQRSNHVAAQKGLNRTITIIRGKYSAKIKQQIKKWCPKFYFLPVWGWYKNDRYNKN